MIKKCIIVLLLLVVIGSLFTGCESMRMPPSVEEVEQHFLENYLDIQTVISFALHSNYENIYIRDMSGVVFADFSDVVIEDEAVLAAVRNLLSGKTYKSISFDKSYNAIKFLQWTQFNDTGCGIVYSINGVDEPYIEYCTQLIPLSKDGWYYYVSDYNEWRVTHSTG